MTELSQLHTPPPVLGQRGNENVAAISQRLAIVEGTLNTLKSGALYVTGNAKLTVPGGWTGNRSWKLGMPGVNFPFRYVYCGIVGGESMGEYWQSMVVMNTNGYVGSEKEGEFWVTIRNLGSAPAEGSKIGVTWIAFR